MAKEVRKYSIDDLNTLIDRIIKATKLTVEEISSKVGRNPGYISQLRSRKKVPEKFYELVSVHFKDELLHPSKFPLQGSYQRNTNVANLEDIDLEVSYKDKYIALLETVNSDISVNRALLKTIFHQLGKIRAKVDGLDLEEVKREMGSIYFAVLKKEPVEGIEI